MTLTDPRASASLPPIPPPGAPQRPPSAEPLLLPARRLEPSPGRDRPWRLLTTLIGTVLVGLVVLALAAASTATWLSGRGYSDVPAVTALGSPTSLDLTSSVGTVRVLPSGDVEELTLALVAPGSTALPDDSATAQARVTEGSTAHGTTVEVRQPERSFGPPWTGQTLDVLLLVPTGLELDLTVSAEVGDLLIDGDYAAIEAHSTVGDLRMESLTAPGGLSATTDVGDVDIELGAPAPESVDITTSVGEVDLTLPTEAGGQVEISTDFGNVRVAAPGTARWTVDATSNLGDVSTDPGLSTGSGSPVGALTVTSELGDIEITR
ncbi:DUF4097 family beta strand repeat-containing protein [Brachybacterium sp.]|uniref:DUF4097 family beta strand repeat-containing protein n=1 Tax=Brachybacterium sp. TaxID=1891286 RepID=UPI002ECFC8DC